MGSNIYLTKDAPRFIQGHSVVLGYIVFFLFGGSLITTLMLRWENSKRVRGQRDVWTEGKTAQEMDDLGDMRFARVNLKLSITLTFPGRVSCILCDSFEVG